MPNPAMPSALPSSLPVSFTADAESACQSGDLTLPPARLDLPYLVVGLLVVMLAYEAAKLLSRKRVDTIAMSEALKAGTE